MCLENTQGIRELKKIVLLEKEAREVSLGYSVMQGEGVETTGIAFQSGRLSVTPKW